MKKISDDIIEDISINTKRKRKTVRAIITHGNKVLMVYSKLFDDYMFPGGHVKKHERKHKALMRELKEELGTHYVKIIKPFGYIREIRYDAKDNTTSYIQSSYYYFVNIRNIGVQNLDSSEQIYGVEPRFISVNEAILHNENIMSDNMHNKKGFNTVIKRELQILKKLLNIIV